MKCLTRNMQIFFYALYKGKVASLDEYGNETGEYRIEYGEPQAYSANISSAKGETSTRQFGESEDYDKVIVMDAEAPDIDEYSVLWIDTLPQLTATGEIELNDEGEPVIPADYIVKKVAKSINGVSLAISKVAVNHG